MVFQTKMSKMWGWNLHNLFCKRQQSQNCRFWCPLLRAHIIYFCCWKIFLKKMSWVWQKEKKARKKVWSCFPTKLSKMWGRNLHNYQYARDNSLETAASAVVFSGLILPGDCLGGRPLRYPIRLRDCSAQPMIVQPPFKFSIVHPQCKAVLQGCTVLDPCSANGDTALQMSTHCSLFVRPRYTWDPIDASGCL